MSAFLPSDEIRSRFSSAMSTMYRQEVPLYGRLLEIVSEVNEAVLGSDPQHARLLDGGAESFRLGEERHGAVRVGTAQELSTLRRVFAVMGMEPVGYYDLAPAGIPVHSTAFRALDLDSLNASPFRVFTSLLRHELIADESLREQAAGILAGRQIVSEACLALVAKAEQQGGLSDADADAFVAEAIDIFRWHEDAIVDADTYGRLLAAHRLVADIVSFRGPHINHLTPRTLDIDQAQSLMESEGMAVKAVIEGPPKRSVPILLRQTSFHALAEPFRPAPGPQSDAIDTTVHTARFGEIEQRGAALTPAGRALYDHCLDAARRGSSTSGESPLEAAFRDFPDDLEELRDQGLIYARYIKVGSSDAEAPATVEEAIARGLLRMIPITYEDFLPVSAAGIFRSNLGGDEPAAYRAEASQEEFEQALGKPVHDPFALYQAMEDSSREAVLRTLGLGLPTA